jgi:hypothetical protein
MQRTLTRIAIGLGLCLLAAVGALWFARPAIRRYRSRHQPPARNQSLLRRQDVHVDPDARVLLRKENPASLLDEKKLKGRTLWVSDGGEMPYYTAKPGAANPHAIDFSHPAGTLQGAERLLVRDALAQPVPDAAAGRIPPGDAQILLVFTKPDDKANPAQEYAVAVGDREGKDNTLLTDQLFFYDDPHTLYAYWGPAVWSAIDQHQAIRGMTERQVELALGQIKTPRADIMGDRNFEFTHDGKQTLVTFVDGKATQIRDLSR